MANPKVGYQPRNTPAERRAFYDLQRQVDKKIAEAADDGITQADADARYVNLEGDSMTGPLAISALGNLHVQRLANVNNTPFTEYRSNDAATRYGYIQGGTTQMLMQADVGNARVRSPLGKVIAESPLGVDVELGLTANIKLRVTSVNVEKASINNAGDAIFKSVTVAADPTVPLGAATKQYVDTTAGGIVAYAQVVAGQGSITTEVDLTGLNVAFTATPERHYKITGSVQPSSTVATDTIRWRINVLGPTVQQAVVHLSSTAGCSSERTVILTGLTGAVTAKLRMERNTGSGTVTSNASATNPSFMLVEDLGIL